MKLRRFVNIDSEEIEIIISDEEEVLIQAKKEGLATIAVDPSYSLDMALSRYMVEDIGDVDEELMIKAACRNGHIAMEVLRTDRLIVRELKISDYNDISVMQSEIKDSSMESDIYFSSYEDFISYIDICYDLYDTALWAVIDRESLAFVGLSGFYYKDYDKDAYLSFCIMKRYRGKGLAYEAAKAIIEKFYHKLSIAIEVRRDNSISIKVSEKLAVYAKDILKYPIAIYLRDVL